MMRFSFFLIIFMVFQNLSYGQNTIRFNHDCIQGKSLVIAAVGDILLHVPLQTKGARDGYESLWQAVMPYIRSANIVYGNLEGPMAPGITIYNQEVPEQSQRNYLVYSGFPLFNYPPTVAYALKNSHFDIVSTANNHALDRDSIGIDKTIQSLDKAGVAHIGTRTRHSSQPWVHFVTKEGFKTAWIACTEHTNGIADAYHQVLYCYNKNDRAWIIKTIQELKNKVDAIIITPHWGNEFQTLPDNQQITFAHQVLNAGAIAVIGSHPHVLQPLTKYLTTDGRETVIMFSLGNFVSYQGRDLNRSTVILFINLTKSANGTILTGVRFVPLYMQNRSGLKEMAITPLPSQGHDHIEELISHVMPMGNALYSTSGLTNLGCFSN